MILNYILISCWDYTDKVYIRHMRKKLLTSFTKNYMKKAF